MGSIADLQAIIIGAVLFWAGSWKILSRQSGDMAVRSVLALVLHEKGIIQGVFRLVGVVELTLGLLLLLPPAYWWEIGSATGLIAGFIAYIGLSMKMAPGRPCGCLGGRQTPTSWRTLLRASLLLLLSLAGWTAQRHWFAAISADLWLLGVLGVEVVLVISLSPELRWTWGDLLGLRQKLIRAWAEINCASTRVSFPDTLAQLRQSDVFHSVEGSLKSDVIDSWRQGCWQFLCFEAEHQGRQVTATFAVPVLYQPDRVRGVIVDNLEDKILVTLESPLAESRADDWVVGSVSVSS